MSLDTARTHYHCAACGRPLRYRDAALLGHWATVRATLDWLGGRTQHLASHAAYVCRGRCERPSARQRLAEQFAGGGEG